MICTECKQKIVTTDDHTSTCGLGRAVFPPRPDPGTIIYKCALRDAITLVIEAAEKACISPVYDDPKRMLEALDGKDTTFYLSADLFISSLRTELEKL